MANFRFQVITAVTWRIVAELIRRHHAHRLRVYETHPGGGQCDCLSIYVGEAGFDSRHLCDFNQQSQHLHIFNTYSTPRRRLDDLRWPDGNDYVSPHLGNEEAKVVVDDIEALVGLPLLAGKSLPSTTPPTLIFRLIAGVLERHMLSRETLDVRCGWHDSSGMEGSYIRDELQLLPGVASELPTGSTDWQIQARVASRFWLISVALPEKERAPKAVLDLQGRVHFVSNPAEPWSVWGEYQINQRRLLPILDRLEEGLYS